MKNVLIMVLLSVFLTAGTCWKIKNKDQRALCESKNEHKKSCWKIKDKDMRAYCEASAYGKKSCWKIKNRDKRSMCEAESSSGSGGSIRYANDNQLGTVSFIEDVVSGAKDWKQRAVGELVINQMTKGDVICLSTSSAP